MSEKSKNYEILEMKMEAMKEVFADMMLNSSKEAAERLMSAKRESLRFQEELFCLRDDSARMMLHLNHNFKTQFQEAEARSLDQQKKIDELEAQLGEAEGIIVDLRDELRHLHEKLENATNNEEMTSNQYKAGTKESDEECLVKDNTLNYTTTYQVSDEEAALLGAALHPIAINSKNLDVMDSYRCPGQSNLDDTSPDNEDFSSLIMQNGAADLYRNGYTQRIRAFDRNSLAMKLPTSKSDVLQSLVDVPLEYSEAKARNNREYPVAEKTCSMSNLVKSAEQPSLVFSLKTHEKNLSFSSSNMDQAIITPRRSAGKNTRYREAIAHLRGKPRKKYVRARKLPLLDHLKACSSRLNGQSVKNPRGVVQKLFNKKLCCALGSLDLRPKSEIMKSCSEILPGVELENMVSGGGDGQEAGEIRSKKVNSTSVDGMVDSELVDVPVLGEFGSSDHQTETESNFMISCNGVLPQRKLKNLVCVDGGDLEEAREVLSKKHRLTSVDGMVESELVDVPVIKGFGRFHHQAETPRRLRPLKFTYHRKCQKNVLRKLDENVVHKKDPVERKQVKLSDVFSGLEN